LGAGFSLQLEGRPRFHAWRLGSRDRGAPAPGRGGRYDEVRIRVCYEGATCACLPFHGRERGGRFPPPAHLPRLMGGIIQSVGAASTGPGGDGALASGPPVRGPLRWGGTSDSIRGARDFRNFVRLRAGRRFGGAQADPRQGFFLPRGGADGIGRKM